MVEMVEENGTICRLQVPLAWGLNTLNSWKPKLNARLDYSNLRLSSDEAYVLSRIDGAILSRTTLGGFTWITTR